MSAPGSPWTPEKDGLLRSMGAAGESTAAIATLLKCTPEAVRRRARLLKIKLARSPPGLKAGENSSYMANRWTPQEDALIRRMAEANTRPEVIAAKLNRSVRAIKARSYMIGLPLKWSKLKAKGKA